MSSLSNISIDRPVLAIVMSIVIIIFGLVALNFLGVREYPSVDPPVISVSTSYAGASADIIETQITEPLEESINSIQGIKSLTSTSRDGRSTITVEFGLDSDLEAAANDVRDKVSQAVRSLPPDTEPPVVSKADADSDPIIGMKLQSTQRSQLEMSEVADNIFKENFQTIDGVSRVMIWGEKRYSIRLWMDPDKLAAYKVTPLDVYNAVNAQNLELPSGRIEGVSTELTVRTLGRLNTPQQFEDLTIREDQTGVIKFRDLGKAEFYPENDRTALRADGLPLIFVVLVPQPGSNNLAIAEEFYNRLEGIKKNLPDDIQVDIAWDDTRYIQSSIDEVEQTIILAFVLVVSIIFLFLRDWRTTFIPVITVPISLIGSLFLLYTLGFSINVLTLLGIVLAIGLVVDDAIVVLENIYSKIEDGKEPHEAGKQGTNEIFFAVLSTTVALAAVFFPIIFLEGITGRLFREFGVVVAGSVIISSFVALTLAPMLSSNLLKKREKHNWFYRKTEPFFVKLNTLYGNLLESFMRFRWAAFIIVLVAAGGIYALLNELPNELAPLEDRAQFRVIASGPEGATFEYMDFYVNQVVNALDEEVPEKSTIVSITSPGWGASSSVNSAFIIVRLKDAEQRARSQTEIVQAVKPVINQNSRARAFVTEPETIGGRRSGLPVQYVLQAPNLQMLKDVIPEFTQKAQATGYFDFVNVDLKFNKPEINIEIDREKAQNLGVSVRNIAQTLQLGLSGQRFGYFVKDGQQYQIIGQVQREDRNDPLDLKSIYVKNDAGELVQMDNLVRVTEKSTPPQLYRYNRFASATISASLASGVTLGEGLEKMDEIAAEVLDPAFQTALAGTSLEYRRTAGNLLFAFGFALVLIYLVLAAQFESFRDPLTIMFTVPLAIAGSFLTLYVFGETLNIFSQIGIIMLIGLVTKNGILIVEFANQRKAQDMSIDEAIIGAAKARFRPILMTSLSTILGILPIALALGAGAGSRVSMGVAVIGGMVFSTVLTLFVIPAIYSYLTSKTKRKARI